MNVTLSLVVALLFLVASATTEASVKESRSEGITYEVQFCISVSYVSRKDFKFENKKQFL